MFAPFRLRGLELANRVVVSPMDMYSSVDGTPGDFHLVHLGARAIGGAGMVMTEMICTSADGRITPGCGGLYRDEHVPAWKRIVDFVHTHSRSAIGAQLGHAGRKGSTRLLWEGENEPLPEGNWPLIAPSPIPWEAGVNQVPREMTRADMDAVKADFVACTERAVAAGFDLLEIHMAHGYLLSSFLSPLTNVREDEYGADRAKYPLEVFAACRAVWPAERPMSVRISATDWVDGGFDGDDAVAFARRLVEAGCDIVDVSTGQVSPDQKPAYGRSYQTPYADRIRHEAGIPVIAVGAISSYDDVNTIILAGRADLCALARPHLWDPHWTLHAAADQGVAIDWIPQYRSGSEGAQHRQGRAADAAAALRVGDPRVTRTVVVTGGKRGIGASISAAFSDERVIALSSADLDVTDEEAVARVFGEIGAVDVLVNNAGVSSSAPLKRTSLTDWERQLAVNATGAFLCTRAVVEGMKERGRGRIVTVASVAAHHGSRYTSGYTASKHAVLGLTRSVAAELAGTGVTCNAVCPAYVRSDMTDTTIATIEARTGRDGEATLAAMAPLGRLIEPEEVAFAVRFFAAEEAGAINGQSLIMDGGGVQS